MSFDPNAAAKKDSGIFGLDTPPTESRVVLLPVPYDATTSYGRRAAGGPAAILEASHQVDLYDRENGRPYEAGICLLPAASAIVGYNKEARASADRAREHGDGSVAQKEALARVNALSTKVNELVYAESKRWLDAGHIVGLVGGDHATPFGLIKATLERYPNAGILHIDAHADLREAYEGFVDSHASIMWNVLARTPLKKLVQVGIRDFGDNERELIERSQGRIVTFFDQDLADATLAGTPFVATCERIVSELPSEVYVSFDIDGLDPALCPNTGTPVPGGLSFHQALALLATIRRSGKKLIGFDLNEVAPGDDGSEWDANVGARMLYKLCGHAIASAR